MTRISQQCRGTEECGTVAGVFGSRARIDTLLRAGFGFPGCLHLLDVISVSLLPHRERQYDCGLAGHLVVMLANHDMQGETETRTVLNSAATVNSCEALGRDGTSSSRTLGIDQQKPFVTSQRVLGRQNQE